jgi:hypothetical protein
MGHCRTMTVLMQKIEEMTLYMVDMNKRINRLESDAELHKQAAGHD